MATLKQLLVGFLLVLSACNTSCSLINQGPTIPSSWHHQSRVISRILDSSVAIGFSPVIRHAVDEQPRQRQAFIPRCSGVFVSPTEIITAGHCVTRVRLQKALTIGPFSIMPRIIPINDDSANPTGDKIYLTTYRDYLRHNRTERTATVRLWSSSQDLAILKLEKRCRHSWLDMRTSEPSIGETVRHVGHPLGEWFTLTGGIISRQLFRLNGRRILHTTAPGHRGSSGGGVFDEQGRLLAIQQEFVQGQTFLVLGNHASDLREFLVRSRGTE